MVKTNPMDASPGRDPSIHLCRTGKNTLKSLLKGPVGGKQIQEGLERSLWEDKRMVTCVPVRMKKILQVAVLSEHSIIHSVIQTALFIHQNPYV